MTFCRTDAQCQDADDLPDEDLLRYSRHILLPQIGIEGQRAFLSARVLVVGVGGLGSPVALYLAAAGVGTLVLADGDTVDLTNLQRQIAHQEAHIGMPKPASAALHLAQLNPRCQVIPITAALEGESLEQAVSEATIVVDCSDNFATRHALNRACARWRKPLVSGAAVRFDGQLSVYDHRNDNSPCYHCLFPDEGEANDGPCATFGVLAPLVGIIGSMQAAETLKLLAHAGEPVVGRLLTLDALSLQWRSLKFGKTPGCPVCAIRGSGLSS